MTHHFNSIQELLELADQAVAWLHKMFPQVDRHDLRAKVLLYLLNNSTIKTNEKNTDKET